MAIAETERGPLEIARELRSNVYPLTGAPSDWDELLGAIGDARYVLLGEATHGTQEFYAMRAAITRRLILEKGFTVVAVEADWPDAYRVNRFVRGEGADRSARAALAGFERFPTWMWRNTVVVDWVNWIRDHNRNSASPVGFYGIDLYSLHSSIHAVLAYLDTAYPELSPAARDRYRCFEAFGRDLQRYGYVTSFGDVPSCEEEVVEQLVALSERRADALKGNGLVAHDELFFAEQNARVVKSAEEYYRAMFRGGVASWNLRDTHMADTVDALCSHYASRGERAKIVVWAHNSHIGDARATELADGGEVNLGQLVRQRHPGETFLLGFSTYAGSVTAAADWDEPAEQKQVRPALAGSNEEVFHLTGVPEFLLFPSRVEQRADLSTRRLHRAIGVVYKPHQERRSHYYRAALTQQFDALVHIDRSRALEPLDTPPLQADAEPPETFPSGI